MGFGRPADFRFRRRFRGSPMVEVWNLFWGGLTAVFGEWVGGSPKMEFWVLFSGHVSSMFGESWVCRRWGVGDSMGFL